MPDHTNGQAERLATETGGRRSDAMRSPSCTSDAEMASYFAAELRGRPLAGTRILEIGFGSGEDLGWAKQRGASVFGCEITASSLAAAESFGVPLIAADFEQDVQHKVYTRDLFGSDS